MDIFWGIILRLVSEELPSTNMCICTYMNMYIHAHTSTCTCVHTHICKHTHVHKHTNTHIHRGGERWQEAEIKDGRQKFRDNVTRPSGPNFSLLVWNDSRTVSVVIN